MTRRRILGFLHQPSGTWRELRNPDGPPTGRQLLRLNHEGQLNLADPGQVMPITKAEAAAALDDAACDDDSQVRIHPPPRFGTERPVRGAG